MISSLSSKIRKLLRTIPSARFGQNSSDLNLQIHLDFM